MVAEAFSDDVGGNGESSLSAEILHHDASFVGSVHMQVWHPYGVGFGCMLVISCAASPWTQNVITASHIPAARHNRFNTGR